MWIQGLYSAQKKHLIILLKGIGPTGLCVRWLTFLVASRKKVNEPTKFVFLSCWRVKSLTQSQHYDFQTIEDLNMADCWSLMTCTAGILYSSVVSYNLLELKYGIF